MLHSGLCHNISAQFLAQAFDTNMHVLRSEHEFSRAKAAIRSSGGSLLLGQVLYICSCSSDVGDKGTSLSDGTPKEDCESFFGPGKKSSSHAVRSGELDDDDLVELSSRTNGLVRTMVSSEVWYQVENGRGEEGRRGGLEEGGMIRCEES